MASAKIIELTDNNSCKICDNALARYSCPRCNILYCSLSCYQNERHIECSEEFYKNCIYNDIKNEKNEDTRAKMLEMLKRTHDNNKINFEGDDFFNESEEEQSLDSDDDPCFADINDRLAGINLDDTEKVWEKLTEDEKQEFVAFLQNEDVSKLIPIWEPWWMYNNDKKIEEVENINEDFKLRCPQIVEIKDLSSITTKTPSDCVKHNLYNILGSYVFTARYFNGEHFDFAKESISCISNLSLALKGTQNFEDLDTALKSIEQQIINSEWILTDTENIQAMKTDLSMIMKGPNKEEPKYYVLCALSDIKKLIQKALLPTEEVESEFNKKFPDHFPNVKIDSKEEMKGFNRKIDYFLAFSKDIF